MSRRGRIAAVLLLAAAVRLWGLGFGLPYIVARPDEPQIAGPAVGFLSGNLRPPFLQWPTLFAYTTAAIYFIYYWATRSFAGYRTLAAFAESRRQNLSPFLYITRGLSAAMGVLTVWWVYAICRRVFDETVALVSALFLALAFLHVRDSHFGVTDVSMTGLVVLGVLAILRWKETGSVGRAALAGLVAGLATATKYNGLGLCVPFAVAASQMIVEKRHDRGEASRVAAGACAFIVALAAGLFGTSPYILIDWTRFVSDISATGSMFLEGHGMVIGRGWWYYARVVLPAAVGWPMLLAGAAGMVTLLATRFRETAVIFAFPIAYYIFAGRGYGVFSRYIIPVVPFLCISAAWFVVSAVRQLSPSDRPSLGRALVAAAVVVTVAPTACKTVLFDRLMTITDNRIVTARALVGILPAKSLVYQSGESYGQVPLAIDGHDPAAVTCRYDERTGRFRPGEPDWILVQQSPLVLYSAVPPWLVRLLAERYVLVRTFPVESAASPSRVYDQQDAFFIPLEHLEGLKRPGPAFELYRRR